MLDVLTPKINATISIDTWPLKRKILNKIRSTQNAMERLILNIEKRDHIRLKTMKTKLRNNTNIIKYRINKWNWAGHVSPSKMEDEPAKRLIGNCGEKKERGENESPRGKTT